MKNNHKLHLNELETLMTVIPFQIQMNLISIRGLRFFNRSLGRPFIREIDKYLCFHHIHICIISLFYNEIDEDEQF
jgi:hypothetical protein